MSESEGYTRPTGRGTITQWLRKGSSLLLLTALLAGAGAVAAVLARTHSPTYCTKDYGGFNTLERAEFALRNSTACYGTADQKECSLRRH